MATSNSAENRKARCPARPYTAPCYHGLNRHQAVVVLKERAKRVSDRDVEIVLNAAGDILDRFKKDGAQEREMKKIKLLLAVVKDFANGAYRNIPYGSIAAIVAALAYVLDPFELIPGVVPIIGLSDNAAVVSVCMSAVCHDLHAYKKWKAADLAS